MIVDMEVINAGIGTKPLTQEARLVRKLTCLLKTPQITNSLKCSKATCSQRRILKLVKEIKREWQRMKPGKNHRSQEVSDEWLMIQKMECII